MGTFLKKQIKGRAIKLPMAILICALLVVGGGIAYKAVATHTATATTVPEFVAGGSTVGYGFNVTNNGTDSVYKITISVQTGSGFSIDTGTISCPTGWTKDSASFNSQAICITDVFSGDILTIGNSVNVAFNATSPTPTVDTQYAWGVATRDVNNGYTYNTDTKTTVDVTAPTTIDNAVTGWGNSNVTVTLTPTDNFVQDVPGSGVTNTYYCIYNSRETVCTPTTSGASMEVTCTEDSVCQKIVRYYSIDNVSKTEEVKTSAVIQIDKKEPVTAIAVGDPKYGTGTIYVKSTTNFTLTATDEGSGVASTTYKIDEGAIIDYSVAGAFTISTAGTHTITYWSVDNIGNTEAVNTLTVFVDDTEPSVGGITITPIFGSYISGTSNISAVITETGSGVASCDYALDGSTWVIARMTYADGICSVSNVDTSAATSINMRATDNVGNVGTSSAIAVTVDTINPAISNVAISPTTPTNDNTPTITFKVADSGSNVNVSTVKVSHGTAEYAATCTTLPDCSVTLPTQADGAYTFTISASDNVGNSASDSSLSGYVIDTVKPTTSDNAPTGWQKTDVTITLTPTDPAPSSGIAWTKYCTDTENTCEPTTEGTSLTISDEGTTYFRYASADLAGNIQNTVSRVVMIDKSVPATSKITAPTTGSHVKDAVTITADAVDNTNGSGIVKVEFYYGTNLINADLDNTDSTYSVDWNTTNVADNTVYSLTAKAIDQAGNPLTSTAVSVTVDNTPPTILTYTIDSEAISPINNDGIKDGIKIKITTDEICDFVIRIENQDGSLAVASEWVSNNTTSVTKPSDCYWKGTTLQCPSSPVYLSDGIYNIKVAITDKAGNSIDAPIKTITVDNLKPVIDSVMPANSTYVQSAVPEISATLSDTLSAIDDATIIMTVDTAVISSSYNSTTGKVSYAASSLGEGSHSVTVIVSDNAGNLHSNSWSFIVDTDDPETTLTANPVSPDGSNNWYVTAPTITLTCSDTINGCFKTYYKWGTSGTYAEYTEILTASEGADTLYYYSIDMAGNEETANNQEFKVDTTDPVVSVLGNAPTGWVVDDESLIPTVGCKDTSGSDCDTNSYKMMYSLIEITKCPTDLNLYSNPPTNVNQPMWVCAYGKDLAGNEDFSDPVHFKYSNTIQAAIDAADPGDTIEVAAGTYAENVVINKSLTLSGAGVDSVIQGAVQLGVNDITVRDFTINGGNLDGLGATDKPSGIYIVGGTSGHTIQDNTLAGGGYVGAPNWTGGRGILFGYSVINVTVSGNEISGWLSGVYVNPSSNLTFSNNNIHNNYAGIGSSGISNVTISGNTFTNNEEGFGADTVGVNVQAHTNKFIGNGAGVNWYAGTANKINATQNWWNNETGPTHATLNPHGTGDAVSANVNYRPWYTALNEDGTFPSLDSTAPTATLTGTPVSGSRTNVTTTSLTVGPSGDAVYYKFKYKLNSEKYNQESDEISVGTPIALPSLADGDYTLSVITRDQSGNWQITPTPYTWTVDTGVPTLPTVTIVSNNTNNTALAIVGNTVTITIVASENLTAKPTVTIATRPIDAANVVQGNNDAKNWTATYVMADGDTEGVVPFTINFTDLATNPGVQVVATIGGSSVKFDRTAPTTFLAIDPTSPDGANYWYVTAPTVTLTCEDQVDLSGCGAIFYKWDGVGSYLVYNGPLTVAEGKHTLYYYSVDKAGNPETAKNSGEIKVDTSSPTVALLSPLSGQTITGGSISYISWTANDTNFGNTPIKLEYSINGPTNNGNPWPVIIEATNHNPIGEHSISEYVWTVPNLTSPSCYVKITATDLAGNSVTKDIGPFTISRNTNPTPICRDSVNGEKTCDITLRQGWNLISSPVVIDNDITTVLSAISSKVNVVQYYDNGTWISYMPAVGSVNTLFRIKDGKGYWIYMNSADTLTLTGLANPEVKTGSLIPSTYGINSNNWNLVGFRSVGNMNAKEYVDHYITDAFGKDYIMWKYENGKSLEPLYSTGDMKSGYGYWLFME